MSVFKDLHYVTASGLRASVGHATDDPYLGSPESPLGIRVRNEGAVGIEWTSGGVSHARRFCTDIQVAVDTASDRMIVIGHGCADLTGFQKPNNGLILCPDGSLVRTLEAPAKILSASGPHGSPIVPDGFSAVECREGKVEIWISYWQGEWLERRGYDVAADQWTGVSGHFRAR